MEELELADLISELLRAELSTMHRKRNAPAWNPAFFAAGGLAVVDGAVSDSGKSQISVEDANLSPISEHVYRNSLTPSLPFLVPSPPLLLLAWLWKEYMASLALEQHKQMEAEMEELALRL